jgi:serine/threonine-protein kinase HipA
MMRLAVELYGTIVGALDGDVRTFDFTPSKEGIERFGANGLVLSVAIPLLPELRREHAVRHRNWFGELLPEGDQYGYMLQQGGLGAGDTLKKAMRSSRMRLRSRAHSGSCKSRSWAS